MKQSSKRPNCIGIVNPSRTHYLAAETEKEYLSWVNAFHNNVKRLKTRNMKTSHINNNNNNSSNAQQERREMI